jgi:beta-glucosidase
VVHPLEGIQNATDGQTEVSYAKGCHTHKVLPAIERELLSTDSDKPGFKVEFFENQNFSAEPVVTDYMSGSKFWALGGFGLDVISKMEKPALSVRFSGKFTANISGSHEFEIYSIGPSRMKLDGEVIIDNWTEQEPGETFFSMGSVPKQSSKELLEGEAYDLEIEYEWSGRFPAVGIGMLPPDPLNLMQEAVELASSSDAVILIVGTNSDWETEGNDRETLELPNRQNELIEKVCQANPKTVVVMNTGAPCTMPWHEETEAILQCWFPGQEFGNSLSDIIFGDTNPSGKLPTTFPKQIEDTPAFAHYPGEDSQMDYLEGLYIGYRWYEKENIEPLFPFGHGLSYTEYSYSNLRVVPPKGTGSAVAFEVEITNTGDRLGKEVVQCYVGLENSNVDRPIKELKAFKKVELKPSESKVCSFELTEKDLSYWDEEDNCWKVESNEYTIFVGRSSADIELKTSVWLG